jgi:peptidoglycan/xylan/chitin deacetylase (PgdA/CDA1 family)
MTTVTRERPPAWGRALLVALWLGGGAAIAAIVVGWWPASWLWAAAIALGLCTTIAIGVMCQWCGFFARPLNRVRGAHDHLALTFDDGPDPDVTPRVLALLAQAGQRATFFVVGERLRAHPELGREIAARGHELANHSRAHRWHMALWPARAICDDLQSVSREIVALAGCEPRFFRPPAAVLSPRIAAGARRAGLELVGYSARSLDGSRLVSVALARRRLLRGLEPGAIVLLHDACVDGRAPVTLELLPQLLEELARRGLASVTLRELLVLDRPRTNV